MKKKHFIGYTFLVFTLVFITILFMTPAVTDECSDEIFECLENVISLSFWEKVKTGISCFFSNLVCVFGNVGNLF